tara:strand:+ start:238 stop:423 length:186 start_codon:yes stop_codon:yes gene_type:complete
MPHNLKTNKMKTQDKYILTIAGAAQFIIGCAGLIATNDYQYLIFLMLGLSACSWGLAAIHE